jgi:Flp pilus assembly protein TadB
VAQTKRRRKRKHRGTPAGTIEARGRTGRPPKKSEVRKAAARPTVRERREQRLDTPPTWRGALNRAAISAVIFGVFAVLILDVKIVGAIALTAFMVAFYLPLSYITDRFLYNRRQRQKAR